MMRTDNGLNKFDTWSYVHCLLSYFIATALSLKFLVNYPCWLSIIIAFALGCLWEINDERYKYWRLKNPFKALWLENWFDRRGASWLDIVMDLAGCLGALWILS